jgi:hypothetical protein
MVNMKDCGSGLSWPICVTVWGLGEATIIPVMIDDIRVEFKPGTSVI